jgi:periplasmic protein TonB
VFEQSIIVDKPGSRPLSFLASISGELLVVSLLVIIPLCYNDHLPAFHWKSVTVGPPLKPRPPEPVPVRLSGTGVRSGVARRPIFVLPGSSDRHPARSGAYTLDPPPLIVFSVGPDGSSPGPLANLGGSPIVVKPPDDHPVERSTQPHPPLPVSQGVQMAKLLRKVIPEYPPLAKSARISGVVHLIGIIAKDGAIRNLELVSGHPLLAHAALEAVRQWVYKPTLLNNEPVEVIAPIEVNFTLSQ